MRISEIFNLNKAQYDLDFIDIDVEDEFPLFLDANVFASREDAWSKKCNEVIIDYFRKVNELIKLGRREELLQICEPLSEPNETCLGYSAGKPRGAFQKPERIVDVFIRLYELNKKNEMLFDVVKSLSELKLFIKDVGNDTVSDIVTSLIRAQLIEYTNDQCKIHNLKTRELPSKPYWNEVNSQWEKFSIVDQLIIDGKRILLVPKGVVFYDKFYTYKQQTFTQHDVLDFLKEEELKINDSPLIQYRKPKKNEKKGKPYVTKADLRKREAVDNKDYLLRFCRKYPQIIDNFRKKKHFSSLTLPQLFEATGNPISSESYNQVIEAFIKILKSIPTGKNSAYEYHDFILGLLTFIFYPSLSNPKKETPIDDEKKRIDISYCNTAEDGFFRNLKTEIASNYIFVECKNYNDDVSNPEFDQLAGRFNASSCKVGFLVCRRVENEDSILKKISAHYRRQSNLILLLTDKIIIEMLDSMKIKEMGVKQTSTFDDILFELKREVEVEKI